MFVYKSHHNDLIIIKHLLLRIKFPTKHLFWVFHFLKLLQWRHFVTYLWNNPRSLTCHTHAQPFYSSLDSVQDNPGELVPEETFTHSHLSWSSVIPYLLPPSITINGIPCSIYVPGSLFPQSLSKSPLVYLLAWHPHLHTPHISSPNHCLLFAALPLTISYSSKSRLVSTFLVLPFWCLLNRMVPDMFQKSSKMVACVCVCEIVKRLYLTSLILFTFAIRELWHSATAIFT